MHVHTHILSGWCLANTVPRTTPRERLLAMIAASIADLDGLGILFGQQVYWDYHHKLGHNLPFGLLVSVGFAAISPRKPLAFALYLACFHLHLLMDYFGSGPGWAIDYFWPFSPHGYKTDLAWELSSWQNRVTFAALLLITVATAWRLKRTPLEVLAPRLDAKLVGKTTVAMRRD